MKTLGVSLTRDQYEAISEYSKQTDQSKSQIIRDLYENCIFLYDLLSQYELNKDPDDFVWKEIEKINKFMEGLKNAHNPKKKD